MDGKNDSTCLLWSKVHRPQLMSTYSDLDLEFYVSIILCQVPSVRDPGYTLQEWNWGWCTYMVEVWVSRCRYCRCRHSQSRHIDPIKFWHYKYKFGDSLLGRIVHNAQWFIWIVKTCALTLITEKQIYTGWIRKANLTRGRPSKY